MSASEASWLHVGAIATLHPEADHLKIIDEGTIALGFSGTVQTAFVERTNFTLRELMAPLVDRGGAALQGLLQKPNFHHSCLAFRDSFAPVSLASLCNDLAPRWRGDSRRLRLLNSE